MIHSFEIENFRLFDHLKIKRLGRVNLVVGKNNSGKSALLEALLLFSTRMDRKLVKEILSIRQEDWDEDLAKESGELIPYAFRHLFKGHRVSQNEGEGIVFRANEESEIRLSHRIYYIEAGVDEDGDPVRRRVFIKSLDQLPEDKEFFHAVYLETGKRRRDFRMHLKDHGIFRGSTDPFRGEIYSFVEPQSANPSSLAPKWDRVIFNKAVQQERVFEGLRLIEPSIEELSFVGDEERKAIVTLRGMEQPVPLKSLGDGMTRVLQIVLSLVASKGGVLAIDELENGLHWSIQPKVWKMIFKLADELDVQVFATTHSRDCVAGFYEAWKENESDGAFFRLMRGDSQPPVQEYDLELLGDSIDTGTEVR